MICSSKNQAASLIRIHHLKNRIHDSAEFSMVATITTFFTDCIEFIEQYNQRMLGNEVKNLSKVRGSLTQK
ncbi:hypothetical protein WP8S18E02_03160 [Aeromonas hydrophila]|nr:hypothetical protein WP8S18E02_03160 [Aeromonas hydrophila]